MWLNFLYTVQLVISDVCTKFQNSRSSNSGEIFDENLHMHFLGVRDGKRKKIKKRSNLISAPWFCLELFTWLSSLYIQNLKTVAVIDAELIRWKKNVGKKETSWLPSKKESNTWGAIFPNPYSYEYKMTGN